MPTTIEKLKRLQQLNGELTTGVVTQFAIEHLQAQGYTVAVATPQPLSSKPTKRKKHHATSKRPNKTGKGAAIVP